MQFSLKTLMIVMLTVAVFCAIRFSLPYALSSLAFQIATLLIPAVLLTIVIHGSEEQRTFAVGALATYVALLLLTVRNWPGVTSPFVNLLFSVFVLTAAGGVSVLTRRFLLGVPLLRRTPLPPPPPAFHDSAQDHADD